MCSLILAHGENWDVNEKTKTQTVATVHQNRPPPYPYTMNSRSRNPKRSSRVRLRQDVNVTRRPAYTRSQSQVETNIPQSPSVSPV